MSTLDPVAHRQPRRVRPTLRVVGLAVAVGLGVSGCGSGLFDGADLEGAPKEKRGQHAQAKPTEKSVRAFYARASNAFRRGDARQLCEMTHPGYAKAMVSEAAAAGVDVTSCPEAWRMVFRLDPKGYKDKITDVAVKGRTATFRSGGDPWRIRLIHGEWLIVDPR